MYVRCDESSLYSRINYSPDGNFSAGVSGNIKTIHWGLAYVLHYANAPVLTQEETGRYDLSVERFV